MDCIDFYRITTYADGKYIDPTGYYYCAEDGTDTPYRFVNFHYMMKLDDFINMSKEERANWLDESVKYIDDLSEKDCNSFFDDDIAKSKCLDYANLSLDTPDGFYHTGEWI